MAREDKLKALDAAISQIEKQYGKGSIMKLGDNSDFRSCRSYLLRREKQESGLMMGQKLFFIKERSESLG